MDSNTGPSTSRRQLLKTTAAFVIGSLMPFSKVSSTNTRPNSRRLDEINVLDCGAVADGSTDCTKAFQRALRTSDNVYVPAGIFALQQLSIVRGKTIRTEGLATVLRQLPATGVPLIKIVGSNVSLDSFGAVGNIASDTGEWVHAVQIIANADTGNLTDISIGDIVGTDIRGDVLYLSAAPGFSLSQVTAGNITGENVYRNVVSITGTGQLGGNVRISNIGGSRVGLYHFDIEPELSTTPVVGVSVGEIRGRNVGVVATAAAVYADQIEIGSLDLNPEYASGSSPEYSNISFTRQHALQVRNTKSLEIGTLLVKGFDGQAVKYIQSDLTGMSLRIDTCSIEDCCRTDTNYYAYVLGGGTQARVEIGDLRVAITRENVSALMLCDTSAIGSISASLAAKSRILNMSPGATLSNVQISGTPAGLAINTTDANFIGGSAVFDVIGYNCDRLHFTGMDLSGRFAGGSATQEHILQQTTLNGTYYDSAIYEPFG